VARRQLSLQAFPVLRGQARETVDLLDQKNVARMRVREQPKQFGPGELGAAFVLKVPGGALKKMPPVRQATSIIFSNRRRKLARASRA
jgi:hypothetical protein